MAPAREAQDKDPERVVIARAEQILADREGLTLSAAGRTLREDAAAFGVPLGQVARDVIDVDRGDDRGAGESGVQG